MPTESDASRSVSSAELVRSFGHWQNAAISRPVVITHHGREKLVLLSADRYRALREDERAPERPCPHGNHADMALEQMAEAFLAFDRDLTVTYANPAACAHYKLARDRLIGRRLQDSVPQIADSLALSYLHRVLASGQAETFEAPSALYQGVWLQFRAFPTSDGVGLLSRSLAEERSYREAAEFKRAIVDATSRHGTVGYARLNVRGLVVRVNESLAAMAGFPAVRLLDARLIDILPPRNRTDVAEAVERVLTGEEGLVVDSALLRADGEEMPVRIALSGLRGSFANEGAVAIVTPLPAP